MAFGLARAAERDLGKLPAAAQVQIANCLALSRNVKGLVGTGLFRLRCGDYRVIFEPGPDGDRTALRIVNRRDLEQVLRRM